MEKSESETTKRIELEPRGITCPEGIWSKEAAVQFVLKKTPEGIGKYKFPESVQSLIRFLLTTPEMEVFTINSFNGKKRNVDREFLQSRTAVECFERGFLPISGDIEDRGEEGNYYFLDRRKFENYLADKPIIERPEIRQSANAVSSYIPPFMQFMLKAVVALKLSEEKRTDKSKIIHWLNENWPDNLGEKSDHLIGSMATILRRPQDKSGGSTPWKNSSRK
ncbi:hypothetical protein [Sneathiella sp.]|uniref:hypothetical protein n=1 Tax=Sneathiella sp. TaxID=1964365 RepID=UPI003568BD5E